MSKLCVRYNSYLTSKSLTYIAAKPARWNVKRMLHRFWNGCLTFTDGRLRICICKAVYYKLNGARYHFPDFLFCELADENKKHKKWKIRNLHIGCRSGLSDLWRGSTAWMSVLQRCFQNIICWKVSDCWTINICRHLNVSKRTLQRYRSSGELPYQNIYHKIYYKECDLNAFIKNHFDKTVSAAKTSDGAESDSENVDAP